VVDDEEREASRDLTSTVVRGVGLAGVGYGFAQAMNLAVYVVLARLIDPGDFGEFAAATVLLGLSLLVTESGLSSAVIQRRDSLEAAAATAVIATAATGAIVMLLMAAASPLIGLFFHSRHIAVLAAASSGTIFLRTIATVPDALLQRRFSFVRRLVIEPAVVVAFGTAAIVAAAFGLGAWSLVIGQYAGYAIDAFLAWKLVRWHPQFRLASYAMWRELVGFGRHVFAATAVLRIGDQASTLLIGRQLGSASLGQFRYGARLASTPFAMLLAGAAYVLFPAFARIADDGPRLERAFLRSLRWVCVLSFPLGLFFVPLGIPLTVLAFGEVWRPAGNALVAMCLLPAGSMLSSVVSEALKAVGRPRYLTQMHLVTTLTTATSVVALFHFGLTAAAASASIGPMVGGAFALTIMERVVGTPLRSMLAEVVPTAVAAAAAAAVLIPVQAGVDAASHGEALGIVLLVGEFALGAIMYLVFLRFLAPGTAKELESGAWATLRRLTRSRAVPS
jgi:O-antigen/teichoic acid export membrane protein